MKKIYSVILLLLIPMLAHSQYSESWLEVGGGLFSGKTFKIKVRGQYKGWTFIYSKYKESGGAFFGTTKLNRKTLIPIASEFKTYGIARSISVPFRWGYVDAGLGVGYGEGTWSDNCRDQQQDIFGYTELCDQKNLATIGIPIHASTSIGKYTGVGFYFDSFLSFELDQVTQVGVIIPLGVFTK